MRKNYGYLILLVIAMYLAVFINEETGLFLLSVVVFISIAIPSLILYYLFYVKKIKLYLRFVLLIIFGYLWAIVISFSIKNSYISIVIFLGISIGILASLFYHCAINKKKNSV